MSKNWIDWKEINKKRKEKEAKDQEEQLKFKEMRYKAFLKARKEDLRDWEFPFLKMYEKQGGEYLFPFLEDYFDEALNFKNLEIRYQNSKHETSEEDIFNKFLYFRYIKEILIPKRETYEYFEEFLKWKYKEKYEILEFLIPSFPVEIKSGNEKGTSNKNSFPAAYSITNHKFINYNSKERINFLCFDLDYHNGAEAIKSFPTIKDFKKHLIDQLGAELEPSFIIQTTKGYQFFYHLKVPVLVKYKNSIQFLKDIKTGLIELLGLDKIASNRLCGVYRGPLQNPSEFNFKKRDFELKDFLKFAKSSRRTDYQLLENIESLGNVKIEKFQEGGRNQKLFIAGLNFAKNRKNLSFEIIFHYILKINQRISKPLDESEVKTISSSVFKYYKEDKIQLRFVENINRGIMDLKSSKLELKEKQKLAAARTNETREINFEANILNSKQGGEINSVNNKNEAMEKLQAAKDYLKRNHLKITKAALIKKSKLSKPTVYKYFDLLN